MRVLATIVIVAGCGGAAPLSASGDGNVIAGKLDGSADGWTAPHVFMTPGDLEDIVARIDASPTGYSASQFHRLENRVKNLVASSNRWDATYSGCRLDTYLYAFSFAPTPSAYRDMLSSDLGLNSSESPPSGAAVAASELALYAALVKAGTASNDSPALAPQAVALAKEILLAWASTGFLDASGNYLNSADQFCDDIGSITPIAETGVGLHISRGVIYSVHAQDLLQFIGALDETETFVLDAFHAAMYTLIRNAMNYRASVVTVPCDLYGNHVGNQLTGLLATARLLGDQDKLFATLFGSDTGYLTAIPWTTYFDRAIYGRDATPNGCFHNTGTDGATSQPYFQTAAPSAGEIDDRFRNAEPAQGIGYPSLVLERLFMDAELLRIAGFDAYGYAGTQQQTIQMAMDYYACYQANVGSNQTVSAANGAACADLPQYLGKLVNGMDTNTLVGAYRFPEDEAITAAESGAKASAPLDSVLFGRWRD
jgi:hypothetical protein